MLDFVWALLFWQIYELLGLPLRFALSRSRLAPEERRALSRVAGPLFVCLPLWLGANFLPGMLHPITTWIAWFLLAGLAFLWVRPSLVPGRPVLLRLLAWDVLPPGQRLSWRWLRFHVISEVLFFILFLGFVGFRRWVPEMTFDIGASAAEKFMNQMLFWANWHARALPAEDFWLAGNPLTYYAWGHFHWAWAGRAAYFPGEIMVSLALARVTLATVESSFLLGRGFGLRRAWALGGGIAAAWFGNPSALDAARKLLANARQWGMDWSGYDFWAPSRAIKHVVDEFPAFSAILGDFHAHHQALPWLLTAWALLALRGRRVGCGILWSLMLYACGLAASLANAWYFPLLGLACALWLAAELLRKPRRLLWALPVALGLGAVIFLALRLQRGGESLPLDTSALVPPGWPAALAKLGLMPVPPNLRSTPKELFGLWGLPLAVIALSGLALLPIRPRKRVLVSIAVWVIAIVLWAVTRSSLAFWLGFLLVALEIWWTERSVFKTRLLIPFLGAWLVLLALELVYLQDRFRGDLVRYNSYFKFTYSAWPILMLAGAGALGALARRMRATPQRACRLYLAVWLGLVSVVAATGLVYPVFAFPARILQARRGDVFPRQPTLNSVDFIKHRAPHLQEAGLMRDIRRLVPPGERVAEAGAHSPGEGAYSYGGRVASLAGHPVPLGWIHHEQQWRGPAWFRRLDARAREVDALYRARTPEALRAAAARLKVRWIVFGLQERTRYGAAASSLLLRVGTVVAAWVPGDVKPESGEGVYLICLD